MSRLNTMYPNDEFLKKMSNMFGKIDSKNETEIKQEIEQIGYKEFYRYYKEKDIYISRLKQENQQLQSTLEEIREYILNHELVEEKGTYVLNGNNLLKIIDKGVNNE